MIFASKRNFATTVFSLSSENVHVEAKKVFNFVSFSEWFELFLLYFASFRLQSLAESEFSYLFWLSLFEAKLCGTLYSFFTQHYFFRFFYTSLPFKASLIFCIMGVHGSRGGMLQCHLEDHHLKAVFNVVGFISP